jgi:heavy metal efflux system protein
VSVVLSRIVRGALTQRLLVLVFSLGLVGYGTLAALQLPVDAFPDVTNIQVQVNTTAPGLAAVEVEQLITFPIETVMNGLPDVTEVRSISKTGLSVVTVVFKDKVDIYFARQLVLERLQVAKERIPPGLSDSEMGPISTGLGQIYKYILVGKGWSAMELRTLNDWVVKFQLRTVAGVTDVLSFGGEVRQYQVRVDPNQLLSYELTLSDLRAAIEANNRTAGGWYIETAASQLVVRGDGLIRGGTEGLRDIENIVLRSEEGTPVFVRNVAEVAYGPEIRQGAVTLDGEGEVVMGIVLQLKGANTKQVIERVRGKVAEIQNALPEGVQIVPVYDQADLVDRAVGTVTGALREAALLIVIVLALFLWNLRSALIVALSIPLSILVALIMMRWYGLSANLQSLGGLAIGIGMMVDGSVVVVENIVRHLGEPNDQNQPVAQRIMRATGEVARPVFFAVLIIVVVFLPLFTLQGVEGKLFQPMAFTIAFAMLGSLLVALTVVPALSSVLLGAHPEEDPILMRLLKRAYRPALEVALAHRGAVLIAALIMLLGSLATVPFLGTEFVPELDEGTMSIRVTMDPSISLSEAQRIAQRLEKRLLQYPEVTYALSQIGRAEIGGDPESISNNEIFVGLRPQSEWVTASSRADLIRTFTADLGEHPGILLNFSQPIATRVDELLSGIKAQIAIKLFGEDLQVLEEKGRAIEAVVRSIPGAADVQLEQISGEAQLVVRADRDALARYGLNAASVMEIVSTAVGGEAVTQVIEGQKRFDVYLRMAKPYRVDPEAIGRLWISSDSGARVLVSQVADIRLVEGPPIVSREDAQRRVVIQSNVRGRDMGGFVDEARRTVRERVALPPGYFVTWGGQFENQQRAQRTLMVVVPVSLGLIMLLLYLSFGSLRNALLIILNVPFALIGGVFSLAVSGQFLSVPSSVGFIALFGVAVLNGVVMVSYFNDLLRSGLMPEEAVRRGAMLRLRPILMTAMVASLGLLPLLLSSGIGSEVQRPLATVVVGGLFTSTLLTLLLLPALYPWFAERPEAETPQ